MIADLDFKSAFDFLCMDWVFTVLEKKGLQSEALKRLRRYYEDSTTIPIVNNIPGRKIINKRDTLRQGDCPSSTWFRYGIDPLLAYLDRRLSGIPIHSIPILGPTKKNGPKKLQPLEQKYTVLGYKCKILLLGDWKKMDKKRSTPQVFKQSGSQLYTKYTQTRTVNGEFFC